MSSKRGKQALFDTGRYNTPNNTDTEASMQASVAPISQEPKAMSPVSQTASAPAERPVAQDSSVETSLAVDLPIPTEDAPATENPTPPASPRTTGRRPGRPSKQVKESAGNSKKTVNTKFTNKVNVTTYFSKPTHTRIIIYSKLVAGDSMSNVVAAACEDMLDYTYQCVSAACNKKFTAVSDGEEVVTPVCCPFCGGKKLQHQKVPTF